MRRLMIKRTTRMIYFWLGAGVLLLGAVGAKATVFFYRYADALRDSRIDGQGAVTLAQTFHVIHDNMRSLTLTKSATNAYEFADEVIQSVNFEKFLENPMALPLPDGSRAFVLKGAAVDSRYVVDYERATLDRFMPQQFLAFGAEMRIREDKSPIPEVERGFGLSAEIKVNSGVLSHQTLLRTMAGFLRVLSPDNLVQLAATPAKSDHSVFDQGVASEMNAAFPHSSEVLGRYVSMTPGVRITKTRRAGKSYTVVASRLNIKIEALKADYPDLGEFLARLIDSFELHINSNYELPNNLRLAHVEFDSVSRAMLVSVVTRDGAIVPTDSEGDPRPDAAINPELVRHHLGHLVTDITGHVLGLTFKAGGIVVTNQFDDAIIAKSRNTLTKLPVPTIEGRALGIFPTWAIDLTIPGSLEEYNRLFTQGLLKGSRGQGSYAETVFDTTNPNSVQIVTSMTTELVNNFFINFGMRVAQSYLWPDRDVLADVHRLSERISGNIAADLQKMSQSKPSVAH